MMYDLVVHEKTYRFQENGQGVLELLEGGVDDGVELLPRKEIDFPYDEIQRSARLVLYGTPEPSGLRSNNFRFLVQAAKILAYLQEGVLYKAAVWINHAFVREQNLLQLFRSLLPEETRYALFYEFTLGAYDTTDPKRLNTTFLIGSPPVDLRRAASRWYADRKAFYTRVVGFSFRMDRFIRQTVEGDKLTIAKGDSVVALREPRNRHDPYAVAIVHQNGEKMGYLRAPIARHIAPLLDDGRILTGRVAATLAPHRDPDERIYLDLEFV